MRWQVRRTVGLDGACLSVLPPALLSIRFSLAAVAQRICLVRFHCRKAAGSQSIFLVLSGSFLSDYNSHIYQWLNRWLLGTRR